METSKPICLDSDSEEEGEILESGETQNSDSESVDYQKGVTNKSDAALPLHSSHFSHYVVGQKRKIKGNNGEKGYAEGRGTLEQGGTNIVEECTDKVS